MDCVDLVSLLCYNQVFSAGPNTRLVSKMCRDESDRHTALARLRLDPGVSRTLLDDVLSQARVHARFGAVNTLVVSIGARPAGPVDYQGIMEALTQYMCVAQSALVRVSSIEVSGDAGLVSWLAPWLVAQIPRCTSLSVRMEQAAPRCACCHTCGDDQEEADTWPCAAIDKGATVRDHWLSMLEGMRVHVPQDARGRITSISSNCALDAEGMCALQGSFQGVRELSVGSLHGSLASSRATESLTPASHVHRINIDGTPSPLLANSTRLQRGMRTLFPNLKCIGSTRYGVHVTLA